MRKNITLYQYLIKQYLFKKNISYELLQLIYVVVNSCKKINFILNNIYYKQFSQNTKKKNFQCDYKKRLDLIANSIIINFSKKNNFLAGIVSEEEEKFINLTKKNLNGKYLLLIDPLDGSNNIDMNFSVGTIFSILLFKNKKLLLNDFLQSGNKQLVAGYILYSFQTILVLTIGNGVNLFFLNKIINSWILVKKNIKIPNCFKEFSLNLSRFKFWSLSVKNYVNSILNVFYKNNKKKINVRWGASMVSDVHRILCNGGIFMYPGEKKKYKDGKLRLMYEVNPISFIIEQAGGYSINGKEFILNILPQTIHQQIPIFLGSLKEVKKIIFFLKKKNNF